MLLYIERKGCGEWIVDVKARVAYSVYGRNVFLPDMPWLTLLRDCELHRSDGIYTDQQRDYVCVLTPERQMTILDTDVGLRPVDGVLHEKLIWLVDYLSKR